MPDQPTTAACTDGRPPAPGGVAFLIIDMINTLEFGGADGMLPAAKAAAEAIVSLRDEADRAGAPIIYVNDNYDQWHSDRERLIELGQAGKGRPLVDALAPRRDDYFVIKPQFSGFYATNLPVLLPRLGASRLVLTGIAADICVLFTAADAHMREYDLWVPENAVAASDPDRTHWALEIMRGSMKAETAATDRLSLADWIAQA